MELFAPFERVHLIGMKVVYRKETWEAADSPEKTDRLRAATYGKAKRVFLESLLELEKSIPGSWSLAAGRCELCERCTRLVFCPSAPQMELGSKTGSGRRLNRFSERLQDCFPELTPVGDKE